jgi:uncharacterized protein (DUF58 family)
MVWAGVAMLLGGLGWYKSINLVLLLAYLMFALLIVNGFLARSQVRRVRAVREPMPPVYAGDESTVRVAVTNNGTRTATMAVTESTGGELVYWFVNRLGPGQSATCTTRRLFPIRGRYTASVRVTSTVPFDLLQYDQTGREQAEVIVLPTPGEADAAGLQRWLIRHVGGDGRAQKVLRRVTTDQADVRGVRPYRHGDSIRTIHWRSSARRGELMVREYDAAPAPDLVMVVEPWLPADPTAAQRVNLEAALSLAVTIGRTWSRAYGTRVTVVIAGDPDSLRTGDPSDVGIRAAFAPLAGVSGVATFAPLNADAFDHSLAHSVRVVVSSRRNSPLATALSRATGRHFVVISPMDHLPWYQPPDG